MKRIVMTLALIFGFVAVHAQETVKKDTYIQKGDVIEATLYFDSGELSQQGFFTKDGKITGEWTSFNRAGNKTATAQYKDGKKVGTWFFWNNDTLKEVTYKNAQIASVNVWENGVERVVSNK